MFGKVLLVGVVAFLAMPVVAMAQPNNLYEQCQQDCAGDGLSCVNKCMGQGGGGDNSGNSQQQVEGGGDTAIVVDGTGYDDPAYANRDAEAAAVARRRNNQDAGTDNSFRQNSQPFGRRRF